MYHYLALLFTSSKLRLFVVFSSSLCMSSVFNQREQYIWLGNYVPYNLMRYMNRLPVDLPSMGCTTLDFFYTTGVSSSCTHGSWNYPLSNNHHTTQLKNVMINTACHMRRVTYRFIFRLSCHDSSASKPKKRVYLLVLFMQQNIEFTVTHETPILISCFPCSLSLQHLQYEIMTVDSPSTESGSKEVSGVEFISFTLCSSHTIWLD